MSTTAKQMAPTIPMAAQANLRSVVFNLPNQLTWMRLALTVVMFILIGLKLYAASLVLFVIAASTDWLDGYFARKYGMVTTLGRILDPFADKVIICGTFIYLAGLAGAGSGVQSWMVVIIVGRELLVTALRGFLEQQGADFSATLSGKLKMVMQCVAAGTSLFCLAFPKTVLSMGPWASGLLVVAVWSAVAMTIASGVVYIRSAIHLLRE